jgi:hypothetical protein
MADTSQEPDTGHGEPEDEGPWHPPNQNATIMAEAASVATSRGLRQGQGHIVSYMDTSQIGQGYSTVGHFSGAGFQELRPSFSGKFKIISQQGIILPHVLL